MDLQSLAALLTGIGGYFSAKAGAAAGQLQGLLTGEELTERRKRMKMAEEAHQQQIEMQQLQKELLRAQEQRQAELFPLQREALATQVETGKLNLQNQRLWNLYTQGVAPSQITDPVLRQEYERFYNYISAVKSLEAVQTEEDLEAVLKQAGDEHRSTLEILGRAQLYNNRMRQELFERQRRGLDINLATGEFQLRTAQLNAAINLVLSNIDREGMNWDKRPTEQKIEAVRKWLKETGLEQVVPPNFPDMFQRIQSSDARQLFLLRAQTDYMLAANLAMIRAQGAINRTLQHEAIMGNIVYGALQQPQQGGYLGVPPVGYPAPPTPNIFNPAPDQRGNYLNQSGLNNYLKFPLDIYVPTSQGNQRLSVLATEAGNIYKSLAVPNPQLDVNAINTLVNFDAGLFVSHGLKGNVQIDWNTALIEAASRVLSTLKANRAYLANTNYKKVVDEWERAFYQRLQQRQQGQQQQQAQPPATPQPAPPQPPAPRPTPQQQRQQRQQRQPPPPQRRGEAPLDRMR
jgi:hypothetical protein